MKKIFKIELSLLIFIFIFSILLTSKNEDQMSISHSIPRTAASVSMGTGGSSSTLPCDYTTSTTASANWYHCFYTGVPSGVDLDLQLTTYSVSSNSRSTGTDEFVMKYMTSSATLNWRVSSYSGSGTYYYEWLNTYLVSVGTSNANIPFNDIGEVLQFNSVSSGTFYIIKWVNGNGLTFRLFGPSSSDSDYVATDYPDFCDVESSDATKAHLTDFTYGGSGNYALLISRTDGSLDGDTDLRIWFQIATMTVSSPSSGNTWAKGTSQSINWNNNLQGLGTGVNIDLYKGGVYYMDIYHDTPDDGSYSWTVGTGLPSGTDYQIRVTSRSDYDFYDMSDYFTIYTAVGTPSIVSPSSGSTTSDNTPTLDWSDVTSAIQYQIQVDDDSGFGSPAVDTTPSNSYYTTGTLSDNLYYWRVRATDGYVWGSYSSTWSLTIDTNPPGIPTLSSPTNGYNTNDNTPYLDWTVPSGSPTQYEVILDDSSDCGSPLYTYTPSTDYYQIATTLSDGTYYWRVRAGDAANNWGTYSSIWSFIIDTASPGTPSLSAPTNGFSTNDNTPYLDWTAASGSPTEYEVQLDDSSDCGSPLYTYTPASDYYTTATLSDGTYYWRVRAKDAAGNYGSYTSIWSFIIDTNAPSITDSQTGDDIWRSISGTTYNVDFSDSISLLNYAQYKITTATGQGGSILKDWTNIFTNLGASSYTTDWTIDFSSCQQGVNYVSVRVYDNAGNMLNQNDVFYVNKDTGNPGITDNQAGDTAWRTSSGTIYNVDFSDGTSLLNYAQYKITTATGQGGSILKDWTNIFTNLGASSYTTDWTIDFTSCQQGVNYVSVRVYDNAGNMLNQNDVFYVNKDTGNPGITDNQAGDDTWRSSSGTVYNVDFSDSISLLNYAQYKITTATGQGGSVLKDWSNIFSALGASSYTTDWTIDFASCQEGVNYISVRVYDYAGNTLSQNDVFYVKKTTNIPIITNNQAGDDIWRTITGTAYDVDFSDSSVDLDYAQYCIGTTSGASDLKTWTYIFGPGYSGTSYTSNWEIDFGACQEGINYISVRVYNDAAISNTLNGAFYVKKDTSSPIIIDNQIGNDTWVNALGSVYNIDFNDTGSGLNYAQYCIGSSSGASDLKVWTNIFGPGYLWNNYTSNWQIDFSSCQQGTNYISVRVYDNAGKSTMVLDVFYVKKDTITPVITVNNQEGVVFSTAPLMDIDFSDNYNLTSAYYKVDSYLPSGTNITGWIQIFSGHSGLQYVTDFGFDTSLWNTLTNGTHTVYFKVFDEAGNIKEGIMTTWQFYKQIASSTSKPNAPVLNPISPNPDLDGNVVLDWNDVLGATKYVIYRFSQPITEINSSLTIVSSPDVSIFTDEGLINGTYYYVVTAQNQGGESLPSNCEQVTVSISSSSTPTNDNPGNALLISGILIPTIGAITSFGVGIVLKKMHTKRQRLKGLSTNTIKTGMSTQPTFDSSMSQKVSNRPVSSIIKVIKICPKCGSKAEGQSLFCPNCGSVMKP